MMKTLFTLELLFGNMSCHHLTFDVIRIREKSGHNLLQNTKLCYYNIYILWPNHVRHSYVANFISTNFSSAIEIQAIKTQPGASQVSGGRSVSEEREKNTNMHSNSPSRVI
jgi:hypothetical protein